MGGNLSRAAPARIDEGTAAEVEPRLVAALGSPGAVRRLRGPPPTPPPSAPPPGALEDTAVVIDPRMLLHTTGDDMKSCERAERLLK
jgi:hypothetical protein